MKNLSRRTLGIVLICVILVSAGVYVYIQKSFSLTQEERAGWEPFVSQDFGISFSYPAELYPTGKSPYGEVSPFDRYIEFQNYHEGEPMHENRFEFGFLLSHNTIPKLDAWVDSVVGKGIARTSLVIDGVPALLVDGKDQALGGTPIGYIFAVSPEGKAMQMIIPSSDTKSYPYFKPYLDEILPTIKFAK
jgi:hypothetical protein